MKRSFPTPRNRAVRMRHLRRRLYLQDGVLSVRFIKFINEQPPAVGAALPEPKPELPPDSAKCIGCYAIFTRGFKSVEGTGFCDDCIRALCPQPEPQTAEDWARGISLGGITPPWPDAHPPICPPEPGQCVDCGLPCPSGEYLCKHCFHAREGEPSPWPGGAA